MRIAEVTFRHRNDFHWIGQCEFCGRRQKYGDGYADAHYCQRVVPDRPCPKCGMRSNGRTDAGETNHPAGTPVKATNDQ